MLNRVLIYSYQFSGTITSTLINLLHGTGFVVEKLVQSKASNEEARRNLWNPEATYCVRNKAGPLP
jgi:hypothetical protein